MKQLCVFCGSNLGFDTLYVTAAASLGKAVAERELGLVYGGASVGVMGAVADAALQSGGKVIGVITRGLVEKEVAHQGLTKLHIVKTMNERKTMMADLSDAFVALPGGLGTLNEVFEILTWGQLGMHKKPCALLNIGGYYDGLSVFLDHCVAQGFIAQRHRDMILFANDIPELFEKFAAYVPPQGPKWLNKP